MNTTSTSMILATSIAATSNTDSYSMAEYCKAIEFNFNPLVASVLEKRAYADCVDYLYPQFFYDSILFKVCFIGMFLVFVSFVIWRKIKFPQKEWITIFMESIAMVCVFSVVIGLVYMVVKCVLSLWGINV